MPYLVISTLKGRELARQPLKNSVLIGRSAECDISIHDILLSRRHCQVERQGSRWMLVDLASKNGSFINDQEVGRCELREGLSARIGKSVITFHAGAYEGSTGGGSALDRPNKPRFRPADPWSALNDTLSGFDYDKSLAERKNAIIGSRRRNAPRPPGVSEEAPMPMPSPQPTPPDPHAYQSDDIYSLLTELVSSSWDSIYMSASRPVPTLSPPQSLLTNSRHPRRRPANPPDLSLQLSSCPTNDLPGPKVKKRSIAWRKTWLKMARGFATVGQNVILVGLIHLLAKA